jgi:hypothetical protein
MIYPTLFFERIMYWNVNGRHPKRHLAINGNLLLELLKKPIFIGCLTETSRNKNLTKLTKENSSCGESFQKIWNNIFKITQDYKIVQKNVDRI